MGNAVKLPLGTGLVSMGWGWVGAVIGYTVLTPVAFAVKLLPSLRLAGFKLRFGFQALRDVLKAGVASWLPNVIAVLGQQLGVLALFGVKGALETGLHYVSFADKLGLAGNLSRVVAYAPPSHLMGGAGVALGYALGAYAALAGAVLVSRRIGFNPGFREVLLATVPPLCLALAFRLSGVSWLAGAPLLLAFSYVGYLKTGVLSRGDLRELAYALAPRNAVDEVYRYQLELPSSRLNLRLDLKKGFT